MGQMPEPATQTNLVILLVLNGVWSSPDQQFQSLHVLCHGCPVDCGTTWEEWKKEGEKLGKSVIYNGRGRVRV